MPDPLVPPHNLEAEKSVLGAVLLDERHLDALTVECGLKPGHFYREQYGQVFAAMLALHARSSKIDHLTVAEQLREAGQLEAIGRTGVPRCGPPCIRDAAGTAPGDCWAIAGDRNRGKARAASDSLTIGTSRSEPSPRGGLAEPAALEKGRIRLWSLTVTPKCEEEVRRRKAHSGRLTRNDRLRLMARSKKM